MINAIANTIGTSKKNNSRVALYKQTIVNLSPLVYWSLNESNGITARNIIGNTSYDGTNSGMQFKQTWFQDWNYHFNIARVNIYSTILNTNLNRNTGTISLWMRPITKADWLPSGSSERLFSLEADDNNRFLIDLLNTGVLRCIRIGGGVAKITSFDFSATKPLSWQNIIMTWGSDELKMYVNGVQSGATQTVLGTFTGNLDSTRCNIGAQNTSNSLALTDIDVCNVAIWNRVISSGEIATVSTPPGYSSGSYLTHSIETSWDVFSLFGITGESLAYFMYDVDGDGDKELVLNIGRRARFAAIKKNGTILWDTTVDNIQAEPARFGFIRGGNMYFANQNKAYAVRLSDGASLWTKTVITPAQTYIILNQCSLGVVVATGTKLDVLDYSTGNTIGGNYPITLPFVAWEQATCVGDLGGNEVIVTSDNASNIRVYNVNGTLRFTLLQTGATQVDWYEFFDVNNDGLNEMVFCMDTDATSSQVAGEGDEMVAYNALGNQILHYIDPLTTGGLQFHCFAFPNGGRVVFTHESDYAARSITMLNHTFSELWRINAKTPYEGDQIVLYDIDNNGTPEILYSTEVFSSTGGFRVLDYNGNPKYFFSEDSPDAMDDIVDSKGAATNNHQYVGPYYVANGELLQGILRTTDNTGHDIIYLHKWEYVNH